MVKLTRQQIGVKIRRETISMIRFANDIVIITENEGDEQKKFLCYVETLTTFKMKINEKKKKY